jgi:hypothetical protein
MLAQVGKGNIKMDDRMTAFTYSKKASFTASKNSGQRIS